MDVHAGPYSLAVEFNEYPIKALKSLEMKVTPEADTGHLKAQYKLISLDPGGKTFSGDLNAYPGLEGAWLLYLQGIPEPGLTDPPGIPMWLKRLIALDHGKRK